MPDINLLRGLGTVEQFKKNQIVFMEDDPGDSMYIALSGAFSVLINSFTDFPVKVSDIKPGSFFGEMSLIDDWPRSATILAEQDGTVLTIGKDKLGLLLEKSPDVASSIIATLRNRAESTSAALRGAGKDAPNLPGLPDGGPPQNADDCLKLMAELSALIRKMNQQLLGNDLEAAALDAIADFEAHAASEALAESGKSGVSGAPGESEASGETGGDGSAGDPNRLLPAGYRPTGKTDPYDSADMLQTKKVTCPYCSMRSETQIPKLASLSQTGSGLDGRVEYKGFDILLYTNTVCPNCKYTDSFQEFSRFKQAKNVPAYNGNQFVNTEDFTGFADVANRTYDEAILSYYMRLRCLRKATSDPLPFAKTWIRLYWLHNDLGQSQLAKEAAEKAARFYASYLNRSSDSLLSFDILRINALLGEMAYSTQDYKQAQWYFEQNVLKGRSERSHEAQELVRECLERYHEIKDMPSALVGE